MDMLLDLFQKFRSLRLQDYKSVWEYAAAFRQINSDLGKIHSEAIIRDLDMVIMFMDGLDSSYNELVADFQRNRAFIEDPANPDLKVLSFNELVWKTLDEERRLRRERDRAAVAMAATTDPNTKLVDYCTRCKMTGHSIISCFYVHPNLAPKGWKPRTKRRKMNDEKGKPGGKNNKKRRFNNGRKEI
ncbi:hypothetical protein M430DRAFT_35637 [Amorphotheca resinae ATCC 22711]|uniref:Retrotransposon gag domain-containing protein n=1 Tax=Amorphotheca resinae ATCC 22711 TaxID=857342 RepID=A0A2T3B0Z4_AMORE|nr:hypothetical protein M430DRAFT_35637 [Amorphotheca resinae ATCC 22711]PSS17078.1 hypothetical protein M430DRAFT_35637 [Amorphotheca resinae ATCC 22711]